MAQVYRVSKAFQSTDQNTKVPDVISTKGGDMHKWMFQVEGQDKPGWMQTLKKPGNELKPGDEVYGIIDEWPGGKAKFVKQDRPQEAQAPARQPSAAQLSGNVNDKLDYLIDLVEGIAETFQGSQTRTSRSGDTVIENISEEPINLDSLPY